MVSENIMVTSQLGIHLRPAGAMCNEAVKYQANISFKYGEDKSKSANAKSVISILASGVKCGEEITLIADGSDEGGVRPVYKYRYEHPVICAAACRKDTC